MDNKTKNMDKSSISEGKKGVESKESIEIKNLIEQMKQMEAENKKIKEENKKMEAENKKMEAENKKIKEEYKKIKEENQQMKEREVEFSKKEETLKQKKSIIDNKLKDIFNIDDITEQRLSKIHKNINEYRTARIMALEDRINKYKSKLTKDDKNNIDHLQEILVGKNIINQSEYISLESPFSFEFGKSINNDNFISFIEASIPALNSSDKKFKDNAIIFFKKLQNEINDFLYIPMLEDNTLCEFKKHIYLGILTNQYISNDYNPESLIEYIFYDESYFNDTTFCDIKFKIIRDENFIQSFCEYAKEYEFNLTLENIKDYMFSQTVKEAYLETCSEIFGKGANFVNMENIEKALNNVYDNVIKNLKFSKLEPFYYGVTLFNKKMIISNNFINNINRSQQDRKKVSYLAGLVMTILHEITHCLTNILPTYSNDFSELSNPFIRTFKKNISVYDFVTGKIKYKSHKNLENMLKEKIVDYKLIQDSGCLFESKLFAKFYSNKYLGSEYFLNKKNLEKSLKQFRKDYEDFILKAKKEKIDFLDKGTEVTFRRITDMFHYGRCLLDPGQPFIME